MTNSKLEELAKLIKARKQDTPYTVLLGSGLSMTPDLLKALDCPDWDAFDEKMKGKSDDEQYSLLDPSLNSLPLQAGYRCLAKLLKAGYFNILLTANIDPHLEDALEAVRLSSSERDFLVHGDQSDEHIVKALSRPQPHIKICLLCGRIRGRIFPKVSAIGSNSQLAKDLEERYLARDSIILGFNDRDFDINRCIPTKGGSLWYITSGSTPDQIKHLQRNRGGNTITGDVADFNQFFCALSTALGLQQEHDIVDESNGSAPPHPTDAINRTPTLPASLRSSFVDNSPALSEHMDTPQKTHFEEFDSLQNQEEVRLSNSSFSSKTEEIHHDINHVQKLIKLTKEKLEILEVIIAQQGVSNVDLLFHKNALEKELAAHQNRLQDLETRKKELFADEVPQVTVKAIEETPLASQQRPHDENPKPADSPFVYEIGKHWAVVVGVSDYEETFYTKNASYDRLETCDNDAEMIYEQLVVRSFHSSQLALFTKYTFTLPNYKAILSRLQSTAGETSPGDLLLFYYSGFVDEDDNDSYLVARDSSSQNLEASAVPLQSVTEIMLLSPASTKVLLFDICHARATTASEDQKWHIDRFIKRILERVKGVTILAAYKEKQSESQYSIFTSLLTETFASLDARSDNDIVTAQDIYTHLISSGKLLPMPLSAPESIIYRHNHQIPDSYLISTYLYTVKACRTLEDVQTELKKNSPIYESTCKRLLEALYHIGDPPQSETMHPANNEAFLMDRMCEVHQYANQVIDDVIDMRAACENAPARIVTKLHQSTLSDLEKSVLRVNMIAGKLRNQLMPEDIDK